MAIAVETRTDTPEPVIASFTVRRVDPRRDSLFVEKYRLGEIGKRVLSHESQAGKSLLSDLLDLMSTTVLLQDDRGSLIGYAYATRDDMHSTNAQVRGVVVDPDINEVGGVEKMVAELGKSLSRQGVIVMEGLFPLEDDQADRVTRVFPDGLIEIRDEGSNRFLKVNLQTIDSSNIIPFPTASAS